MTYPKKSHEGDTSQQNSMNKLHEGDTFQNHENGNISEQNRTKVTWQQNNEALNILQLFDRSR
jgi:hypothetical protein